MYFMLQYLPMCPSVGLGKPVYGNAFVDKFWGQQFFLRKIFDDKFFFEKFYTTINCLVAKIFVPFLNILTW